MEIYYSTCVNVFENRWRSLVASGNTDKTLAIIDAMKSVNYYKTECNYQKLQIEINEYCPICNNNSMGIFHPQKRNKFLGKWKTCPNCKGKFPTGQEIINID